MQIVIPTMVTTIPVVMIAGMEDIIMHFIFSNSGSVFSSLCMKLTWLFKKKIQSRNASSDFL